MKGLIHNPKELRDIADVLDVLNRVTGESDSVGFDGRIEMFWCDRLLGTFELNDRDDLKTWAYRPSLDDDLTSEDK